MLSFVKRPALGLAFLAGMALPALAADIYYEPPVIEAAPPKVVYKDVSYGGWYLRGDVDYHMSRFKGADYITYGVDGCCVAAAGTNSFDVGKLKGAFSVGAGVGYQISRHLRADLTADYWFKSDFTGSTSDDFNVSVDRSTFNALLLLANAYVDLGTWNRVTPYVGAGIGGAYVKWGDLANTIGENTDIHRGTKGMRFAWALMAGASYCITDNWKADLGYRFSRISGGRMFEYADSWAGGPAGGPGFDKGIDTHEIRAGLRYQFGAQGDNCGQKVDVAYDEPQPVYMPVYK